jgi:gliding motility-associated-like protein
VTDNCTGATITGSRSPGSTFNAGTTPVTYTARDAAGNTSTCTFNVIVQDAVKPVLSSCPSDISVSAGASCQAVVTWTPPGVTDNCTGVILTGTHPPGSTFGIGTTPVSYTATDQAGNSSTCTFNVIVKDGSKPVLSGCPNDIVVNANTSCVAVADWVPPTATDNCSTTVSGTHTPGSTFAIGTTTVTYTATDAAGNSAQCTFSVIVKDTSVPVISGCPADITVVADASCQAVVSWIPPEFSDECSDGQITGTHNPGSAFEVGSTLVTYSAIDAAGNTASCSFTVNVESPDEAHFVDCPQNIVVENFSEDPIPVVWTAPVLSAPCGSADVTSNFSPGDEFEIGTTHVSYSGITQRGRTITCSFDVTVVFRGIIVHEVITPNGDGENDTWTIKNIENFPENNVVVFDRWGSVVYQASRYDGTSKTWAGSNVPAGTYYYTLIVKTADRNAEYKGFVELVK